MSRRIKINPFSQSGEGCRYINPKVTDINERFVCYNYAEKFADELNISKGERITAIVNGSFIFGDFIEAFIIKNKIRVKKMTLSTLSYNDNNIDSLKTLMLHGYVDNLNIIVSDYFYGHERADLIPYTYQELDNESNTFQLAIERTHCKVYIFETYDDRYFVLQGSVNLRSSGNTENFTFEDNKQVYSFYDEYLSAILDRNKTIDKSLKFKKSWQADQHSKVEESPKQDNQKNPKRQAKQKKDVQKPQNSKSDKKHFEEFMF